MRYNMKILVTGANGNLGNYLCQNLLDRGHSVRALVHYNTHNIERFGNKIEVRKGDIRFEDECFEAAKDCDGIIHLAACINVDRSRFHPRLFYETNVHGTMNILEAARKYDCKVILKSTCEIIGNIPEGKADEEYPFKQPLSPYASSKYAAEAYCFSYHKTYDLKVNIARGFNLCGPRQKIGYKGAVVPIFVDKALSNNPLIIFGDGNQTRDYTDVRDNVRGLALLIESNHRGELFHLCSGNEVSINMVAKTVNKLTGNTKGIIHQNGRPGELRRSVGDNTKAKTMLEWEPTISFEETVQGVIAFQKGNNSI
jgi:UDP-glucose 4-epimerase